MFKILLKVQKSFDHVHCSSQVKSLKMLFRHWKNWILCDKRAEGQIALSEPLILSPYWSGTWNCCTGSSNDEKKRKIIYYHMNYHIEDRIWIAAKIDCVDVLKMEGKAWTGTRFPAFNRINHFPPWTAFCLWKYQRLTSYSPVNSTPLNHSSYFGWS